MGSKNEYLVCYDYGQGGIWAYLRADSEHEIEERYPELEVVGERPDWLTNDDEVRIRERMSLDIDDADHPLFSSIRQTRNA